MIAFMKSRTVIRINKCPVSLQVTYYILSIVSEWFSLLYVLIRLQGRIQQTCDFSSMETSVQSKLKVTIKPPTLFPHDSIAAHPGKCVMETYTVCVRKYGIGLWCVGSHLNSRDQKSCESVLHAGNAYKLWSYDCICETCWDRVDMV